MQARVVEDAERAQVDEAADPGGRRGVQDVAGALGVDEPEAGAAVPVARDRGEVEDRVGPLEGGRQRVGPGDVALADLDGVALAGREAAEHLVGARLVPDEGEDAVTGVEEGRDEVTADEPVGAGDEDGGHSVGLRGLECANCK